jgi:hypothetical protein
MTAADIAEFAAKIFAMWALGFSVGWSVTNFRDATSKI